MGKPGQDWTPSEDYVLKCAPKLSALELTELLPGRSMKSIQKRRVRLCGGHVKYKKSWSADEDAVMAEMAAHGKNISEIALALGRTRNGVKHRMSRFNACGGNFSYAENPPTMLDPWPADMAADAFKDIKLKPDVRFTENRPERQTGGGVGSGF